MCCRGTFRKLQNRPVENCDQGFAGKYIFRGKTMIKGLTIYSAGLLFLCVLTVTVLRLVIPNDHSYASMALMVLVFAYPFFVKARILNALCFGVAYTFLLSIDSIMEIWWLGGPKSGESVVLLLVAGAILTALNILGIVISKLLNQFFTVNSN
tara:strand:- start:407 stop:865 length:459 start_codon:yes stop_codon:yes gene_type:complete